MTLYDIIAKVQYMKDKTWEIRRRDKDISLVEWTIFEVPVNVFNEAVLFFQPESAGVEPTKDNRLMLYPMPQGSMCRIIIFSEYVNTVRHGDKEKN